MSKQYISNLMEEGRRHLIRFIQGYLKRMRLKLLKVDLIRIVSLSQTLTFFYPISLQLYVADLGYFREGILLDQII